MTRPRWPLEALFTAGAVVCATVVFGALYAFLDHGLRGWIDHDLERRSQLVWHAMDEDAADGPTPALAKRLNALTRDRRVVGVISCWDDGRSLATDQLAPHLQCRSPLVRAAVAANGGAVESVIKGDQVQLNAYRSAGASVVVVQDRTFVTSRRRRLLQGVLGGGELIVIALFFIGRATLRAAIKRTRSQARELLRHLTGEGEAPPVPAELKPLADDFSTALLRARRGAVPPEDESGAARLRRLVEAELGGSALVVVSNREPYMHEWSGDGGVRVVRPPSGLVTGIEPILRACGGVWVAHGSGSADRTHTSAAGHLPVPPAAPEYLLRRLFFSGDEYDRYYFGFANEGLWPLCHIAHTRPTFRASDWAAYESVNDQFAAAAVEEAGADGLLLMQDYHFGLAPRLARARNPLAVISLFWHIPWPNWEVIGICPWKEALLDGMLGADVIGFHTRYYCLNFLYTLQHYVECRVDFDEMSVEYQGRRTLVRPYPISVEWPFPAAPRESGAALRQSYGIADGAHVVVGVDRADYTKGLLERIAAIERLLEHEPALRERIVFVQLAAPTRAKIRRYRDLMSDVEEAVTNVNDRFATADWKPVILTAQGFSPEEVRKHYAMADSALVTPIHDGMNLVAKEYVASCEDLDGALVLSTFAGAARELEGALLVNPYDIDAVADAISRAVHMPRAERRSRMALMRERIAANSIYDWSASLLRDLIHVRQKRDRFWRRRHSSEAPAHAEIAG